MINQKATVGGGGGKKCIGKCQPSLFFSQDEPSCSWDGNLGSASFYLVTWLLYFLEGRTDGNCFQAWNPPVICVSHHWSWETPSRETGEMRLCLQVLRCQISPLVTVPVLLGPEKNSTHGHCYRVSASMRSAGLGAQNHHWKPGTLPRKAASTQGRKRRRRDCCPPLARPRRRGDLSHTCRAALDPSLPCPWVIQNSPQVARKSGQLME